MSIENFLINEDTYQRMLDIGDDDDDFNEMSYEDFYQMNLSHINSLSPADRAWTLELCKRISKGSIQLMDEESCVNFEAGNIYFDKNKRLCIVNPR
jgi:hypothetical protein